MRAAVRKFWIKVLAASFVVGIVLVLIGVMLAPVSGKDFSLDSHNDGDTVFIRGEITDSGENDDDRGDFYFTIDDETVIYSDTAFGHDGEKLGVMAKVKKDSNGEKYIGEGFYFPETIAMVILIAGAVSILFGCFFAIPPLIRK